MSARPGSSASELTNASLGSQACLQKKEKREHKEAEIAADSRKSLFGKIIDTLWATRQTRDVAYSSDLLIKTTLKELIIYVVFLVVICIVTFGMTNGINFYYSNVMQNLFLEQTSSDGAGVSFRGIGSIQDFWDVHMDPIMSGLYWEKWYNGENASEPGFIYFENKLLGVPRLRQLRVEKGSCKVHSLFKNTIKDCYDSYSFLSEDKKPFGKYATDQTNMVDTAFFYQPSNKVKGAIVSGEFSTYGAGGYVKNLGQTEAQSLAILQDLKDNNWIDRGTRVVFLDFTVYNANINMFCQIRLTTEFPATGGAYPTWTFRTVKLIRYVTALDYFVLTCEIIFGLFVLYYTIEEALEIKIHKLKYFKEVWNVLDVVILLICYICMIFNIYRVVKVNDVLDSLLENNNEFADFNSLAYWQTQFNNAIAITAFISWIKFFKYISFNKTMTQLSATLSKCVKDIIGFAIMFYIVFFAYAQLGYLLFGSTVADYSTFSNTLFTLFRIILGDFDFGALESQSRVLGPIYFLSYVFFVFFVLLNMFLAIINDTYSDVKSDINESKSDFELGEFFKRGYNKLMVKMNLKKDKIQDIQDALANADTNKDSNLNFDEWKEELRKRGYAEAEIEAYFAQYDKDGNRNLTQEEQDNMKKDLSEQSKKIDKDMKGIEEDEYEKTEEELAEEAAYKKANMVTQAEFKIITARVDTMENSIGNIVTKIDSVLNKLETIEKAKLKRREAMTKLLDKLNEANNTKDEAERVRIQKMIKDELDKWEEPRAQSPEQYNSRAISSATSYTSNNMDFGRRSAWRQQ